MADVSRNLENLFQKGHLLQSEGLTTYEQIYAYLEKTYTTVTEDPDTIREVFNNALPELDVCVPEDQIEARQKLSNLARHHYLTIATNAYIIPKPENCPRAIEPLFRSGTDADSLAYNEKLSTAISGGDFETVGEMYDEFLRDLPSFDPDDLANLPDEEVPSVFASLYTAHIAVQEAKALLSENTETAKAIKSRLSPASIKQLEEYTKIMDLFSTIKTRCDFIANPHYAYIDTNKIIRNSNISETLEAASTEVDDPNLMYFLSGLSNGIHFIHNNVEEVLETELTKDGFDLSSAKFRNEFGREYPLKSTTLIEGTKSVLNAGNPLFCTSGDTVKILAYKNGKLIKEDPLPFLEQTTNDITTTRLEAADALLNSSLADPFWMLTGSSQYRDMKRALSAFQKAAKGQDGFATVQNEAFFSAAAALESSALEYMKLKNVDLEEHSNFKAFCARSTGSPLALKMNPRELARMEAAYSILELGRDARNTSSLVSDLSNAGALKADVSPLFAEQAAAEPTRAEYINKKTQDIRSSEFFTEPVAAVGDDNTAETLRQDLNATLFPDGSQGSFLNKKFFTAADRQIAENVLAKAIILDMIKSGRKMSDPPVPTEQAYKTNPEGTINEIKQSEVFRNAVGERINPEGMRNFLAERRHTSVGREFLKDVLAKQQAKNPPSAEQEIAKTTEKELTNTNKQKKSTEHTLFN